MESNSYQNKKKKYNRLKKERYILVENIRKNKSFIELSKDENGILNERELIMDKEFFNDMILEIERNRENILVYTPEYKNYHLKEWIKERDKKLMKRELREKIKMKNDKVWND